MCFFFQKNTSLEKERKEGEDCTTIGNHSNKTKQFARDNPDIKSINAMRYDFDFKWNASNYFTLHRSDLIWFVPYKKSHGETRYNVHFKESLHIENLDLNY